MKKILFSLCMFSLVAVLLATNGTNEVEGVDRTIYTTFNTPRFMYDYNSNNSENFISFTLDTNISYYDNPTVSNIKIDQYNEENEFIKTVFYRSNIQEEWERDDVVITTNEEQVCATSGQTVLDYATGTVGEVGDILNVYNVTRGVSISTYPYGTDVPPEAYYTTDIGDKYDNSSYTVTLGGADPCTSGDIIRVSFQLTQGTQYFYDELVPYSVLDFEEVDSDNDGINDPYLYKVLVNNQIVNTGAFLPRPEESIDFYGTEGVEVGKYYLDGYKDNYNQEDYYYDKYDEYIIIHYELDNVEYGSQAREIYFQLIDITTNTVDWSVNSTDILQYQNSAGLLGGSTLDDLIRVSFIIVPIRTSDMRDMLETDIDGLNDLEIVRNFTSGAFLPIWYDGDTTSVIDENTTLMLKGTTYGEVPFQLSVSIDEIEVNQIQRIEFEKTSEEITEAFETITAKDNVINYNYNLLVDESPTGLELGYRVTDYQGNIGVQWLLIPLSMPYSLDPNDYEIDLSYVYEAVDTSTTETRIFDLFAYWGVETEEEQFIVFLGIMAIVNIIVLIVTYFIGEIFIPIIIVNMILLILGSFIGLVPLWFGIGVSLLLLMLLMLAFRRSKV